MQLLTKSVDEILWTDTRYCQFQVAKGYYYPDGWINSDCEFLIKTRFYAKLIKINFWNPDFARKYIENRVHFTINGEEFISPYLFPGEAVTFVSRLAGEDKKGLRVRIRSEAFCRPSGLDQRERGIILTSGVLSLHDDKPETPEDPET